MRAPQQLHTMNLNALFIGDVVGKTGMNMVETWLPSLQKKYHADFTIVNAENASDGKGCTEKEGKVLFNLGVDVLTGGNHTWDKQQLPPASICKPPSSWEDEGAWKNHEGEPYWLDNVPLK